MATVDKTVILTDAVIDELMDDWLVRDKDTFVHIRKKGRIGWEKTLEEGSSYSSYLLEAPSKEDLIKRAYSLAKETIIAMDLPFKVRVQVLPTSTSYTTGEKVCVSTGMFDDPELSTGEMLDTFLGVTIHEGCHLLYTDFKEMPKIPNQVVGYIYNVIEDERIEELCGEKKPGFANFLEKSKYYYFDQYYLDYVVPKEKEKKLSPFDRIMNCFLHIIRYPKYLKEDEIIEFGHYLLAIKRVILPYPETTAAAIDAALKVFDIIKDFYEDLAHKESGEKDSSESGDSSSGGKGFLDYSDREKAERRLFEDAGKSSEALGKLLGKPMEGMRRSLPESSVSEAVLEDKGLLGEVCEGTVELGSSENVFITRMSEYKDIYMGSLSRVRQYVPAISRILKSHCKDYKLVHRSMRSGALDTNKLAEAFQGVSTVYLREGEVKTDKVSVCILIDESGSMGGKRIQAARDVAVLINEAIGKIPNVELFIYGHSGDIKRATSTELYVYREKGYFPKFSLGSVKARSQNRDGVAIIETARRVRKQTKNEVLMFILSDGAPDAYNYSGNRAIQHVKECVTTAEKLGFSIIQVCINHSYDPGRMFRHYVILEDMNTLAIELGKVIKNATLTASKVTVL